MAARLLSLTAVRSRLSTSSLLSAASGPAPASLIAVPSRLRSVSDVSPRDAHHRIIVDVGGLATQELELGQTREVGKRAFFQA